MRHVVEAGTDAALVWLFDPSARPSDFEECFPANPGNVMRRLAEEGRLVCVDTGADGAYLLHAFVDESIPSELEPHISDPLVTPDFEVPSGRLFFTGGEYGSPKVADSLSAHPHMGGCFTVAPGSYELTLWRAEYAGDHQERVFAAEASPAEYRVHQSIGWLVLAAVLGGLVVLTLVLAMAWSHLHEVAVAVEVLLIALPFLVARLPIYRRSDARWHAIGRRYPSIVARLAIKSSA